MAIHAPITGALTRAPSNVAPLPTAAPRKVQQPCNRAARTARASLPQHPAERLFPSQREALTLAKQLDAIEPSPAMELIRAILGTLDDATRMKVAATLAVGVVVKRPSAEQAMALLRSTRMTVGERVDLDFAFRRLREGC